jgi:hypothetical protein
MEDGSGNPKGTSQSQTKEVITKEEDRSAVQIDHLDIGKKALLTSPHKKISKESLKTSPFAKKLRSTINSFVPNVLSHWFIRRKIISEVPLKYLKEAILLLDQKKLPEVTFVNEKGDLIPLNHEDIKAILPELDAQKLEEILAEINQSPNESFRNSLLGSLSNIDKIPIEEISCYQIKKLHMALILLSKKREKYISLIKSIPNFLMRKILALLSQSQLWEVLLIMDKEQVSLAAPYLLEETSKKLISDRFSFEKVIKLIPSMPLPQIEVLVRSIFDKVDLHDSEKTPLLSKTLKLMSPKQIAAAIIHLNFRERKFLLGPFWKRPMGVTTAIANGKMKLHQIVAGVTHPLLTAEILNAVEWMSQKQILATKSILSLLTQELEEILTEVSSSLKDNSSLEEEQSFLIECCGEIVKLRKQKYHILFREIHLLSEMTDRLPK